MADLIAFFSESEFFVTLLILYAISFHVVFLVVVGKIAKAKNMDASIIIALSIFFLPAMLAYVAFLPSRSVRVIGKQMVPSGGSAMEKWSCPKCMAENPNDKFVCGTCGYRIA